MSSTDRIRLLGRSDQGGRPDGVQIMVAAQHAFIGHAFSSGVTIVDVRDPRAPVPAAFIACPPNIRSSHIQVHDNLLLTADTCGLKGPDHPFTAGMRVFDVSDSSAPREIGFMPVGGLGLHRIWWVGGRHAYASGHLTGFTDEILLIIDLADPARPELVGRWWLPGMHAAGGEIPTWPANRRVALHHMITAGAVGYATWRDGGFAIMDLSDPVAPRLVSHINWSPPYAGMTHTPLPLPGRGLAIVSDEPTDNRCASGLVHTWVVDIRAPDNPVTIATLPTPREQDYCNLGGRFGPHNLHENRPGSWQSEEIIFATYHNAGVRVFDIRDAYAPRDIAHFIPARPERLIDFRPGAELVTQSSDVFASAEGILYVTDTNGGLSILEYLG